MTTTTYNPTHICQNCEKEFQEHPESAYGDFYCQVGTPNSSTFTPSNRLTFNADKALAGWAAVTRDESKHPKLHKIFGGGSR